MVGVPGKSKGCATCRRRKKGCDLQKPACRNCLNSGYVCGGYQRDLTFILHPTTKVVEKAHFLSTRPIPPLLALLPSLDRTAVVTQCQTLFYDIYIPHGKCNVKDYDILFSGHPLHWTEVLPSYVGDESALDLAFSALSLSRFGRRHNETRLVKESSKLYGKALKNLQKALFDPTRMQSEQVLAACQLLGLYETFEGAGSKSIGWVSHAQGTARIIELRGPHAHTAGSSHHLFVASRVPIIYSSILRRKRTFLADPEWLTVPWKDTKRTGMDMLVDSVTAVPGILEEIDTIKASLPSSEQRAALLDCLNRCHMVQQNVTRWMLRRKENAAPIVVKHQSTGEDDDYPFTHDIVFENFLFVSSNLIFCSANLVLSTTAMEIELLLASLGYQSVDILQSTTTAQHEARQYATNIAQCIPYCLWPDMGDLGTYVMSFPICLAFKFFLTSNETEICAWLIRICNEMQHCALRLDPFENSSPTTDKFDPSSSIVMSQTSRIFSEKRFEFANPILIQNTHKASSRLNTHDDGSNLVVMKKDPSLVSSPQLLNEESYGLQARQIHHTNERSGFEIGHDIDSDVDTPSPISNLSYGSSADSRQGSVSAAHVPKHLAQLQIANARNGDFTFVAEDPSSYYIVGDDGKT